MIDIAEINILEYKIHFSLLVTLLIALNSLLMWNAKMDKEHKSKYFSYIRLILFFLWLSYLSYHIYDNTKKVMIETELISKSMLQNFKLALEIKSISDNSQKRLQLLSRLSDVDYEVFLQNIYERSLFYIYLQLIFTALIFCIFKLWMNLRKIKKLEERVIKLENIFIDK